MNAEITLKQKVEDAGDTPVCAKSVVTDPTACDSTKGGVTKQGAYCEPYRSAHTTISSSSVAGM